jgi:hypothetical protein
MSGSTRIARRVGTLHASRVTAAIIPATAKYVAGSTGLIP